MKKVAIVLSGCGVFDGSEIREAVLTILALEREGASIEFFAPDVEQRACVNHRTNEPEIHPRNAMTEAARIARGKITDLKDFDAGKFDAIVFPGGFGAAQTLCTFATDGAECAVLDSVKDAAEAMFKRGKPMGFVCIAPVIAARLFGSKKVVLTIGKDAQTAEAIEKMGARHITCESDDFIKDTNFQIYSSPAYMLDAPLPAIEKGISAMIADMLK